MKSGENIYVEVEYGDLFVKDLIWLEMVFLLNFGFF